MRAMPKSATLAAHPLLQALAFHVLHDDVRGLPRPPAVVHRDDGRVVQAGRRLGLDAEALDELVVGSQPLLEHLDGHQPPEALVTRQVHVGHAPAAEAGEHAVAPVERRGERGRVIAVCVVVHRGGLPHAAPDISLPVPAASTMRTAPAHREIEAV
jgi:hypothetical protein